MAEPVRFGVFGSGFMGQTWSRVIARHVPEATLVAVSGGRGAADVAREHGAEVLDQDALLARPDGVPIGLWSSADRATAPSPELALA